jgi:hypothetical protein
LVIQQEFYSSDVVAATCLVQSCASFFVSVVYVATSAEEQLHDSFGEAWVPLWLSRDVVFADLAGVNHSVLVETIRDLQIWREAAFKQRFDGFKTLGRIA